MERCGFHEAVSCEKAMAGSNCAERRLRLLYEVSALLIFFQENIMRLDKYLKVSRIIKRRTVANEACDASRVSVNGKPAKASYEVKTGDIIEIGFGSKALKVRVIDIKETVGKAGATELYEVLP